MTADVSHIADLFKALGDPTRLNILRLLAVDPAQSLCVGAVARRLGISQPAVSQHLKILKYNGLVVPNRDGFRIHYSINPTLRKEFESRIGDLCHLIFEESGFTDESLGFPTLMDQKEKAK